MGDSRRPDGSPIFTYEGCSSLFTFTEYMEEFTEWTAEEYEELGDSLKERFFRDYQNYLFRHREAFEEGWHQGEREA